MIKNICIFALLVIATSIGLSAEKSAQDIEATIASVNTKKSQLATDMTELEKQIDQAAKKAQALQKERDAKKDAFDETRGGIFGLGSGSGDKDAKKKFDEADALLKEARKSERDLRKQAVDLRRENQKLTQEAGKGTYDLKTQNKAIATALSAQNLLMDFSELQMRIGDTDATLEKLSNEYDKSLLGAYLKDKVGLLLNSQTMCEAVSRCVVKDRKEVTTESIQKTLFPGTENSSRKGNLYDKTHGNGGTQ